MRYPRGPLSVAEEVEGRENDEKRLLRHLMRGYERDVRPVKNASTPVVIQLSITLTQIFDMVALASPFFLTFTRPFHVRPSDIVPECVYDTHHSTQSAGIWEARGPVRANPRLFPTRFRPAGSRVDRTRGTGCNSWHPPRKPPSRSRLIYCAEPFLPNTLSFFFYLLAGREESSPHIDRLAGSSKQRSLSLSLLAR